MMIERLLLAVDVTFAADAIVDGEANVAQEAARLFAAHPDGGMTIELIAATIQTEIDRGQHAKR